MAQWSQWRQESGKHFPIVIFCVCLCLIIYDLIEALTFNHCIWSVNSYFTLTTVYSHFFVNKLCFVIISSESIDSHLIRQHSKSVLNFWLNSISTCCWKRSTWQSWWNRKLCVTLIIILSTSGWLMPTHSKIDVFCHQRWMMIWNFWTPKKISMDSKFSDRSFRKSFKLGQWWRWWWLCLESRCKCVKRILRRSWIEMICHHWQHICSNERHFRYHF